MRYLLAILLAISLVGCSYDDVKESLVPKEESSFAQEYLNQLRIKNFEYVTSHLHPEVLRKIDKEILTELSGYFPQGELQSTELMGSNVREFNGNWSATFSFESRFSDGWSVSSVAMAKEDTKNFITSISVYRTPESQKVINSFANAELSFTKILALSLTAIVPLFMLITCISVYRTPMEKKWRWYILSFVGVGGVMMNWTTGEFFTKVMAIKLFGVGCGAASEFSPIMLSFTVPVGAIMFWIKRKKLLKTQVD